MGRAKVPFDSRGDSLCARSFWLVVGAPKKGISIFPLSGSIVAAEDSVPPHRIDDAIFFAHLQELSATLGAPTYSAAPIPARRIVIGDFGPRGGILNRTTLPWGNSRRGRLGEIRSARQVEKIRFPRTRGTIGPENLRARRKPNTEQDSAGN